jgi:hypothetical protein
MGLLSRVLERMHAEPLRAIQDALMARAGAQGKQEDDQSVILIRIGKGDGPS